MSVGLAALSLVFTFLTGVTAYGETARTSYIYGYFNGENFKAIAEASGAVRDGLRAQTLCGLIFSVLGLAAVLALAGLTCFRAVKKYALKQDCNVEKFAVCTYLAYAVFTAVIYSLNASAITSDGATVSTGYNFATIIGLSSTTSLFIAWFVIKSVYNFKRKGKNLTVGGFVCSLIRVALLASIIILATLPIISVNTETLDISVTSLRLLPREWALPTKRS